MYKEKTIETALRIRKEIEAGKIRIADDDVHVTATMGVATYQKGITVQELIRQAESALERLRTDKPLSNEAK